MLQTDSSSLLLQLLPGRLVPQTPAHEGAVKANLISLSQHARSVSTRQPSPPCDLGWSVRDGGAQHYSPFLRPVSHTRSWVKNVTLQLPWQLSVSPLMPKHISDFLKIKHVVFSGRLLSRSQPSQRIPIQGRLEEIQELFNELPRWKQSVFQSAHSILLLFNYRRMTQDSGRVQEGQRLQWAVFQCGSGRGTHSQNKHGRLWGYCREGRQAGRLRPRQPLLRPQNRQPTHGCDFYNDTNKWCIWVKWPRISDGSTEPPSSPTADIQVELNFS